MWTADTSGYGSWKDAPGSESKIKELQAGDYVIENDGEYTILAIGGRGGNGGRGGKGKDGYGGTCPGCGRTIDGAHGGVGAQGGRGGWGFVTYSLVTLSKGDILNITLGEAGEDGIDGTTSSSGVGTTGTNGTKGGTTIVKKNGSTLLSAEGGNGGTGGTGGSAAMNYSSGQSNCPPGGKGGNGGTGGSGACGGNGGNRGTGGYSATPCGGDTDLCCKSNSGFASNGTSGSSGGTCQPNSTSNMNNSGVQIAAEAWPSTITDLFDRSFSKLSELVDLTSTKNGRVFIMAKLSQFPL